MTKYREILRLSALGLTLREIAASLQVSQHTIIDVRRRAKELSLSWPLDESYTDAELQRVMFPKAPSPTSTKRMPDYDVKDSGGEAIRWYRVRKSWADSKTQKGAYKILDNAKKCADQNPRYKVFDADGKVVYEPKAAEPAVKVPFLVKVSISDLNIRTGNEL